jgi:hypothetical protein
MTEQAGEQQTAAEGGSEDCLHHRLRGSFLTPRILTDGTTLQKSGENTEAGGLK